MTLADTSVWIDHLHRTEGTLAALLLANSVLIHPFIIGELSLGNFRRRDVVLTELKRLPRAVIATDDEVLGFIDHHRLAGLGIGYIDVHLLVSARLTPEASFWTRDKRLAAVVARFAPTTGGQALN